MTAVFRNQLVRFRGQILGWGVALSLLALLLVSFYGTLQENAEQFQQMIEAYPPEMMAFFGGDMDDFTSPEGYLSAEFFSIMPIIIGIFTLLAGSGLLASDEENGTLDLIAAQPISRSALFFGRLLAFIVATALILGLTWLGLWGGALFFDFPATAGELLLPFISLLALILLYGTLALFLSMVLPSRRMAAMVTGILLVGSYFITSLSLLNSDLEGIADFSPFTYYQSGEAMSGLNMEWLLSLLAITLLFALLAWWRFQRRDIRVAGEGGWRLALRRRAA